ncbi:MAG: DUF2071 domain-containing protein, partial [Acidobacteriia bacterium]|nr:DUF2071 domain-containing protein [Terriglobia bacterium]
IAPRASHHRYYLSDTFDGSAWLGITPFLLEDLRAPGLPAFPWISRFPETNCRTYVRGPDGRPAIWFFSLDAARMPAVAGARLLYGLPYAWSRMRVQIAGDGREYASARRWPGRLARTAVTVERGGPLAAGPLEIFLTARFRLYSILRGRLMCAQVEHEPWPLEGARVVRLEETLTRAAGLPAPEGAPLAHFSPGVRTRIGAPGRAAAR